MRNRKIAQLFIKSVRKIYGWKDLCTDLQQLCRQMHAWNCTPSVLRCCWLGLLTCKTHYRVREPTAAWQFVDIRQHRLFDNGRQYVSCGQRQPPLSGAPVNKMAVNYHEGETDPSRSRVWWISSSLRDIFVPPYRQLPDGLIMTTTTTTTSCGTAFQFI